MDGGFHAPAAAVILRAPPGSGKATHKSPLQDDIGLVYRFAGNLQRTAERAATPAGRAARQTAVQAGRQVSEVILPTIPQDRLAQADDGGAGTPDGFARTGGHAAALDKLLSAAGRAETAAIRPESGKAAKITRLPDRFGGAARAPEYQDRLKPCTKAAVCDRCGAVFDRRAADTAGTLWAGLRARHARTEPLVAHCRGRDLPERGDAVAPVADARKKTAWAVARSAR